MKRKEVSLNSLYKRKKRTWLYCLSILIMLVATFFHPTQVKAAKDEFEIINGELTGYYGSALEVKIPEGVTSIGDRAFFHSKNITKVIIPNSVTSIGVQAFYDCDKLTKVVIPKSVTTIGDYAFERCSRLSSITIPSSVKLIGCSAFKGTEWLKAKQKQSPMVVINHILIDGSACKDTVSIPKDATTIAKGAFLYNSKITKITIPNSIKRIECNAFGNCVQLTTVILPNNIESIGERAFSLCRKLKSINLPNSLTKIGSCAFEWCETLSDIQVPTSVTSIGKDAFQETKWIKLKLQKSPLVIANKIVINGTECKGDVVIPDSVTTIGEGAFCELIGPLSDENYDEFKSITISTVTIPASVKRIDDYAFHGCDSLTSVKIKGSGVVIGNEAFNGCVSLKDVTLPTKIKSIGSNAFLGTPWLEAEQKKNELVIVGGILIDGDRCNGRITIPNSVKTIANHSFGLNCQATEIVIPRTVTTIEEEAFSNPDEIVFYVSKGSYAQKYAKEHKLKFKVD